MFDKTVPCKEYYFLDCSLYETERAVLPADRVWHTKLPMMANLDIETLLSTEEHPEFDSWRNKIQIELAKFLKSMSTEDQRVTVTVRLIRSFEHRTIKHVVFKNVDLSQNTKQFLSLILEDIKTRSGLPPPFKKHNYDTLKISHQPFGAKTSDPVINKENDELILECDKTLQETGIVNETEISCFKLDEYRAYQKNPTLVW